MIDSHLEEALTAATHALTRTGWELSMVRRTPPQLYASWRLPSPSVSRTERAVQVHAAQQELSRQGWYLTGVAYLDNGDLVVAATLTRHPSPAEVA